MRTRSTLPVSFRARYGRRTQGRDHRAQPFQIDDHAASMLASMSAAQGQATLEKIKARGLIICGTSQGVPGFSTPDDKGKWTGFDTDFCRALAAVIFDDPTKRNTPRSRRRTG